MPKSKFPERFQQFSSYSRSSSTFTPPTTTSESRAFHTLIPFDTLADAVHQAMWNDETVRDESGYDLTVACCCWR